jgi:hypothetical protein
MVVVMLTAIDVADVVKSWLTAAVVVEEVPLYVAVVEVAVGR